MNNKRTRYEAAFKAKVALAALCEEEIPELCRRYGVAAWQVVKRKPQPLDNAQTVFSAGAPPEAPAQVSDLLKKVGERTMERDFFSRGLLSTGEKPEGPRSVAVGRGSVGVGMMASSSSPDGIGKSMSFDNLARASTDGANARGVARRWSRS